VKYRDGHFILVGVFADEARNLERAGFRAHPVQLRRDGGTLVEADLWIQDEPKLTDYLHAAFLLFDTVNGTSALKRQKENIDGPATAKSSSFENAINPRAADPLRTARRKQNANATFARTAA
jgi:hypothetical protein